MAHGRALPRPRPRHRADRAEQPGPLSSRPRPAPPASPSCGTGGQHGCARGGGSRGCRPSPRSQLKSESHLSTPPPLTKQVTWPVPCPAPKGGRESVSSKHSPLPFCGLAGKSVPRQRGERPPWCTHVVDACSSPAMAPSFSQKYLSLSPEKPSACQPRCVVPPGATGFAAHTSPPTAGADPGEACGPRGAHEGPPSKCCSDNAISMTDVASPRARSGPRPQASAGCFFGREVGESE